VKLESLDSGQIITVGEIKILPIIRVHISCQDNDRTVFGFASKGPVAFLVISPQGKRILNLDGEEVPIGQYEEVRGLRELLQS